MKTATENKYDLKKMGTFFTSKEGTSVFKFKNSSGEFYWMNDETYGDWLKRIINHK
jgi:hypothetical protein